MVVAVAMIVMRVGVIVRTVRTVMIVNGLAARKPASRAEQRDAAGDDRAEQRQEDDELVHRVLNPA
jgi:hypothetical protein